MTHQPRHQPIPPLWRCRTCAHPWPCGPARLALLHQYADNHIGLTLHLATLHQQAVTDLHDINPHTGPDPRTLHQRFLGWIPRHHRHTTDGL
jgi:hypothetical protein